MINFFGCELLLDGIQIEGIILLPIIKVQDSKQITLINMKFIHILTFYPLNLIDILYINEITISNYNELVLKKENLKFFYYNHIQLEFAQCRFHSKYYVHSKILLKIKQKKIFIQIITQQIYQEETVQKFFDEILAYSDQKESFIKLKSVTNQTKIFLKKVLLINSNSQNCWNGLLFLQLEYQNYHVYRMLLKLWLSMGKIRLKN
ncbi:unnamed protein product [Paramecium pentaurelia]|uniref:Uncharacterized protein n=1 Tax=Paramecium pentaurelia TaxID=43138 RepID=A0A8S1UTH0_9CILI|nr:unnamed protein product [Paramecium pentaurelia]